MVENVWGLVAVLVFYVVILVIGIVAGRKQLRRSAESDTTETMLAGRDIGMVRFFYFQHYNSAKKKYCVQILGYAKNISSNCKLTTSISNALGLRR